jgi:hypothetical protein
MTDWVGKDVAGTFNGERLTARFLPYLTVTFYDAGQPITNGTWSLSGETIRIDTPAYRYSGHVEARSIIGVRVRKGQEGRTTETWQVSLPNPQSERTSRPRRESFEQTVWRGSYADAAAGGTVNHPASIAFDTDGVARVVLRPAANREDRFEGSWTPEGPGGVIVRYRDTDGRTRLLRLRREGSTVRGETQGRTGTQVWTLEREPEGPPARS